MTAKVEVRPGSTDDFAALVAGLGERHWFTDRLVRKFDLPVRGWRGAPTASDEAP